jgi:hypothetical protein
MGSRPPTIKSRPPPGQYRAQVQRENFIAERKRSRLGGGRAMSSGTLARAVAFPAEVAFPGLADTDGLARGTTTPPLDARCGIFNGAG